MEKILDHFLIYCYYRVYVFQLRQLVYVVILDFLFINKLFSSFFFILCFFFITYKKSRKKIQRYYRTER